ncbi:MAG: UDP-N-acetylglucosamine 2-epimerase (non-hydrolyzing) [Acidimicrobiales bacterium]
MTEPRLLVVAGTRPEAIKVAPVVLAARRGLGVRAEVVATGQHTDILEPALARFGIEPDHRLPPLGRLGAGQADLLGRLLPAMEELVAGTAPDAVLVQGDTASALAGAMVGFWQRVPVVHLEAGLRSFDTDNPFPEETYRRLIADLAALHLAPTSAAVANLAREAVPTDRILRIGNTVVDAARIAAEHAPEVGRGGRRLVLVTVHRRENWGGPLCDVAVAVRQLVEAFDDLEVVIPLHPNPLVRRPLVNELGDLERVRLVAPMDHATLIGHLRAATLVLTDSGGIQEEAPTFGTPVLVLRTTTERPEAVDAGCARLVGTDPAVVLGRAAELLADAEAHRAMAHVANPFGDGEAGRRAVEAVRWLLGLGSRPAEWHPDTDGALATVGAAVAS